MKSYSLQIVLPVLATCAIVALTCSCSNAADTPADKDLASVPVKYPAPTLKGTPDDLPTGIDPVTDKPPVLPQIPKAAANVALGKTVTSSDKPFSGALSQLTDGQKEAMDDQAVEFKKGTQWIQLDLGAEHVIHAVAVWHDHRYIQAFRDVIVQVSNDAEFKTGVTTVFNNDTDNTSGQGVGTGREYFEQQWGKVVAANGVKGRYIRSYTRGSNASALNAWQEIEVYALPAK